MICLLELGHYLARWESSLSGINTMLVRGLNEKNVHYIVFFSFSVRVCLVGGGVGEDSYRMQP